jgi:hydroxymethylbilane synthase
LAVAGLERLGLADRITEVLDPGWMLPAVGQGALGLECRADDVVTRRLLQELDDDATRCAVLAERAFLRGLGGGCLVPIGARGTVSAEGVVLRGAILSPDGRRRIAGELAGRMDDAEGIGHTLAEALLARGGREALQCGK